jgi:uncharacterized protein involved in response to NO
VAPGYVAGHRLFFPAISLYAALAVPAAMLGMFGFVPAIPGLATPWGHGREMIFGFGLGAVAGHQLGPVRRPRLALVFACWLAARIAYLGWPASWAATAANIAFAVALAICIAPRMLSRARRLRGRVMPAGVIAACALCVAAMRHEVLLPAVMLLALLMLMVGGRLIGPAAAGSDRSSRMHPGLEMASTGAVGVAALAALVGSAMTAAIALLAAGAIAATRIARWRPWRLAAKPDVLCLILGYAWLAAGLLALGAAVAMDAHITTALHLLTVGALGTLALNVMALTVSRLARRDTARERLPVVATLLVAIATFSRVAAPYGSYAVGLYVAAAVAWSAAYLVLLAHLATCRPRNLRKASP